MTRENKNSLVTYIFIGIVAAYLYLLGIPAHSTQTIESAEIEKEVLEKFITERTYKNESKEKTEQPSVRNIAQQSKAVTKSEEQTININEEVFNSTQVRLNTEIYKEAAEVFNKEHILMDYGNPNTELYASYVEYINPIVPLAISVCETGMWMDTKYTWSPAIYSKLLANKGVALSRTKITDVNVDTYVVNGLCLYMGCGKNCTADLTKHYHTIGNNDNDSLGPLQILRHYVEADGCIKYPCGESTSDLMNWHDNLEYILHTQTEKFADKNNWNNSHKIESTTELVALMAIAHNTGTAYLNSSSDAGSLWRSSQSVYDYCAKLGSLEAEQALEEYIDDWYTYVLEAQQDNQSFALAGQLIGIDADKLLTKMGVDKTQYAKGWSHKQYYPLFAVLNYLSLEKLYYSGNADE